MNNIMIENFNFYVGVLPKDSNKVLDLVSILNEDADPKYQVFVKNEYDDPEGYYTYVINGNQKAYRCFLEESSKNNYIKSLTHYEE